MRISLVNLKLFQPKVTSKWKGGRLHRLGLYLGNIANDYKTVAMETVTDIRDHPIKGSFYISCLAGLIALIKTNPTHQDYLTDLFDSSNDISIIDDSIRNPRSNEHIQILLTAQKDGRLKYMNFLFCSVMWIDNFNSNVKLYEAQCKHLKVGVTNFHEKVVDIGVWKRWWWINEVMQDYDVNPVEWGETVGPVNITQ